MPAWRDGLIPRHAIDATREIPLRHTPCSLRARMAYQQRVVLVCGDAEIRRQLGRGVTLISLNRLHEVTHATAPLDVVVVFADALTLSERRDLEQLRTATRLILVTDAPSPPSTGRPAVVVTRAVWNERGLDLIGQLESRPELPFTD